MKLSVAAARPLCPARTVRKFVLLPAVALPIWLALSTASSAGDQAAGGKDIVVDETVPSGKQVVVQDVARGKQTVVEGARRGTVAGRVFDDANADGVKNSNESYLSEVEVKLLNANDEVLASRRTDSQGVYVFENVDSGQYQLKFDFGENKVVHSQPFAVVDRRSSVIVEPVPYYKGFEFDRNRPVKIHRIYTAAELSALRRKEGADGTPPQRQNSSAPTSPFRP